MAKIDRKAFLAQTGVSTLADLVRLRMWSDVGVVVRRLLKEAGPAVTAAAVAKTAAAVVGTRLRRRGAAG